MPDIADKYDDVISDVRFITDYTEFVFSDEEVVGAIKFSIKEIRAMLESPELEFENEEDNFNARRALMWATCYHLKVKSGELGGMPMSIGDVNMSYFSDRGEHYSQIINWIGEFRFYLDRLEGSPKKFGHASVSREGRVYSNDPIGDAYGDDS